MIKFTKLFLIFSFLMLAPMDFAFADMSVKKVAKKTKFSIDKSDGMLILHGPKIKGFKHDPYYIVTLADPEFEQAAVHYLVVEYDFFKSNPERSGYVMSAESAYRNFYTADDNEGNSLETATSHREFDGCNDSFCYFDETFRITIDHEYFKQHSAEGINLRAITRAGIYIDLYLYPDYVQGMLQRLREERTKLGF